MSELSLILYSPSEAESTLRRIGVLEDAVDNPAKIYWLGCTAQSEAKENGFCDAIDRGDLESLNKYNFIGHGNILYVLLSVRPSGTKHILLIQQPDAYDGSETCLLDKEVKWDGAINAERRVQRPPEFDFSKKSRWELIRDGFWKW